MKANLLINFEHWLVAAFLVNSAMANGSSAQVPVAPKSAGVSNSDYYSSRCNVYTTKLNAPLDLYCVAKGDETLAKFTCAADPSLPGRWSCSPQGVVSGALKLVGGKEAITLDVEASRSRPSHICQTICSQTTFTK